MRPGSLIAAGCFALLSVFRAADGSALWAGVFAVLAVLNLAVAFRAPSARRDARQADARERKPPTRRELLELLELQRSRTKGWLGILVAGWVLAVGGTFVFPPMSIVLAGAALYSTLRYRRCRQSVAALQQALAVT